MALTNITTFDLEAAPGGSAPVINASQGDIGRQFQANLYWNGETWTPGSGVTCKLRGHKPDNTVFEYTATISGSTVTFSTTEQMTIIDGAVDCELVFTQNSNVIASANFVLMVEDSPYNPDALSESDIPTIGDLIEQTIGGDIRDEVDALITENPELMLQDNSVTTPKLAAGAVTEGKIASNAVTTGKLATGAVTSAKVDADFLKTIENYYVTPEMFGAVGDGVTDDTAALNSAIAASKAVVLQKGKTYLVTETIVIPKDKVIYGNNAKIKKETGYGVELKSYDTWVSNYWWETSYIDNLRVESPQGILFNKAIRFMLQNTIVYCTEMGVNVVDASECFVNNLFVFASGANNATGLKVSSSDNTFNNIIIVNAKYGLEISRGANRFNNVHGWLSVAGNYSGSEMVIDKTSGGAGMELNQFYFDTYQTGIHKYYSSPVIVNAPFWYTNENIVATSSAYFLKFEDALLNDTNKTALLDFVVKDFSCSLSETAINNFNVANQNLTQSPFKFGYTFMPPAMVNKALTNNIYYTTGQSEDITDSWILFASGFSFVSGYVHKCGDKVKINCVIKSDSELQVNSQKTLGSLAYAVKRGLSINSFVLNSNGQWGGNTQNMGYIFMGSNAVSINTMTTGNLYIKINLEYPI